MGISSRSWLATKMVYVYKFGQRFTSFINFLLVENWYFNHEHHLICYFKLQNFKWFLFYTKGQTVNHESMSLSHGIRSYRNEYIFFPHLFSLILIRCAAVGLNFFAALISHSLRIICFQLKLWFILLIFCANLC